MATLIVQKSIYVWLFMVCHISQVLVRNPQLPLVAAHVSEYGQQQKSLINSRGASLQLLLLALKINNVMQEKIPPMPVLLILCKNNSNMGSKNEGRGC